MNGRIRRSASPSAVGTPVGLVGGDGVDIGRRHRGGKVDVLPGPGPPGGDAGAGSGPAGSSRGRRRRRRRRPATRTSRRDRRRATDGSLRRTAPSHACTARANGRGFIARALGAVRWTGAPPAADSGHAVPMGSPDHQPDAAKATVVYTDGACRGNPGPGGWAWAVDGKRSGTGSDLRRKWGRDPHHQSADGGDRGDRSAPGRDRPGRSWS